jgi:hypothetical protein
MGSDWHGHPSDIQPSGRLVCRMKDDEPAIRRAGCRPPPARPINSQSAGLLFTSADDEPIRPTMWPISHRTEAERRPGASRPVGRWMSRASDERPMADASPLREKAVDRPFSSAGEGWADADAGKFIRR